MDNFRDKKDLFAELAEIVNKFNSEAVQIKVVEHLLGIGKLKDIEHVDDQYENDRRGKKRRPRRKIASNNSNDPTEIGESVSKARRSKKVIGTGAVATLVKIYESGFFSQPRIISAIISHAEIDFAKRIKQTEISGKLARMVREGLLRRIRNSEGQYEYSET